MNNLKPNLSTVESTRSSRCLCKLKGEKPPKMCVPQESGLQKLCHRLTFMGEQKICSKLNKGPPQLLNTPIPLGSCSQKILRVPEKSFSVAFRLQDLHSKENILATYPIFFPVPVLKNIFLYSIQA